MNYKLEIAEELQPILDAYRNAPPPPEGTPLQDAFRSALREMAKQVAVTSTDDVLVENRFFDNRDGLQTQLRVFTPLKVPGPKPLFYWIHGGGTMSGLPEQDDSMLYALSLEIGCVVTSVNYRLTPEHPYPVPLNDCYDGLLHVVENAVQYNINPEKIAIGGGSAGGLLSTSCAIRARNENGPKLVHQSLTYPMLDHRDTSQSNREITNVGVWDSWMNHYGFQCYLRDVSESDYAVAVPALVADLSRLPDTFLAVGTMDCLRDEAIEYAQRLAAAGVQTELHLYPGMSHVFDGLAPEAGASKDFWQVRANALRRAFNA